MAVVTLAISVTAPTFLRLSFRNIRNIRDIRNIRNIGNIWILLCRRSRGFLIFLYFLYFLFSQTSSTAAGSTTNISYPWTSSTIQFSGATTMGTITTFSFTLLALYSTCSSTRGTGNKPFPLTIRTKCFWNFLCFCRLFYYFIVWTLCYRLLHYFIIRTFFFWYYRLFLKNLTF